MTNGQNKPVALVTGGRQGLGRGAVLALAESGFDIVIVDIVEDERAADTMAAATKKGASTAFFRGDISDLDSHAGLVERVWSAFRRIDCLVNNAGVAARPLADVLDVTVESFDKNLDTNLRGTFFLTQAIAKRMIAMPESPHHRSIVVVTSVAAEFASVTRSQYAMSKAALSAMAKTLAVRLADAGVCVYEIRPGLIRTEMTAGGDPKLNDERIASGRVPIRRWGEPADVGATIASLASGKLSYVTGQVIFVDGGVSVPRY
jgi:3-oxoacyl-[acyl-carrier protein] reductase